MKHEMHLNNDPYTKIKNGTKTIELRVNDEKRQILNINDDIEFTNKKTLEKMLVRIKGVYKYQNFKELYQHFNKISLGYDENEIADYRDMEQYYSKEEQTKYGVVAIEVQAKRQCT